MDNSILITLAFIVGGLILIAGGILFFIYVMQGALGGAVTGACIGAGVMMGVTGVQIALLPAAIIHIDETTLYLPKTSFNFSQLQSVELKGKTIVITPAIGRKIAQGFLKNSSECHQAIITAMQSPPTPNMD